MPRTGIETICLSPNFIYVHVYVYVMFSTIANQRFSDEQKWGRNKLDYNWAIALLLVVRWLCKQQTADIGGKFYYRLFSWLSSWRHRSWIKMQLQDQLRMKFSCGSSKCWGAESRYVVLYAWHLWWAWPCLLSPRHSCFLMEIIPPPNNTYYVSISCCTYTPAK